MDRLPSELLHRVFFYISELADLHRGSVVCRHWRSSLMSDEHFLNKWFHLSLKHSQQPPASNENEQTAGLIDRSQFPVDFQSSECHLLPLLDPFRLSGSPKFFERKYPSSLFAGFHSFSFWFFFSRECELVVRIGHARALDLHSCLDAGHKPYGIAGKQSLLADQWIHLVFANPDSYNSYRTWINGRDSKKFDLHQTSNCHLMKDSSSNTIALSCKMHSYSMQSPIEGRFADLVAFKRCLSTMEIRAIYQQQTCIDRVQVGRYMTSKKRKQSAHDESPPVYN